MKHAIIFFIAVFFCRLSFADTASATQHLSIIIPKIALIDVANTLEPLQITLDPMVDAGDNFAEKTVIAYYDVTSNIQRLRLYAKTDIDLINQYNISLKVNEVGSAYTQLETINKKVSFQGKQAQIHQELKYKIKPIATHKTIPHGNVDVNIIYTLVEY
jgi:hypothetical protein